MTAPTKAVLLQDIVVHVGPEHGDELPRMRIYCGRVMHRVIARGQGRDLRYESRCRKRHPVKGVSRTIPRVEAPAQYWTADNVLDYPACTHCTVAGARS